MPDLHLCGYNRTLEYQFDGNDRHSFWREYSDAVNRRLLAKWQPGVARDILKTDAFDEACTSGPTGFVDCARQTLTAIDIAPAVIRRAAANHASLRASCADVRRLPFRDESFDWVISTSTLDHFACEGDIRVSLREIHRVLRPTGELLLTLDNLANPFVALRNWMPGGLSRSAGLSSYDVGVTWTPWRLRREIAGSGFDLIASTTTGQCPRAAAVLLGSALGPRGRRAVLRFALACEKLSALPIRWVTGHFTAVRAAKSLPR